MKRWALLVLVLAGCERRAEPDAAPFDAGGPGDVHARLEVAGGATYTLLNDGSVEGATHLNEQQIVLLDQYLNNEVMLNAINPKRHDASWVVHWHGKRVQVGDEIVKLMRVDELTRAP